MAPRKRPPKPPTREEILFTKILDLCRLAKNEGATAGEANNARDAALKIIRENGLTYLEYLVPPARPIPPPSPRPTSNTSPPPVPTAAEVLADALKNAPPRPTSPPSPPSATGPPIPASRQIAVHIPADVHRALRIRSAETDQSFSLIAEEALRRFLNVPKSKE